MQDEQDNIVAILLRIGNRGQNEREARNASAIGITWGNVNAGVVVKERNDRLHGRRSQGRHITVDKKHSKRNELMGYILTTPSVPSYRVN